MNCVRRRRGWKRSRARLQLRRCWLTNPTPGAPYVISDSVADMRKAEPVYHIVRILGQQTVEIVADETMDVQPGDTVKVEIRI